MTGPMFGTPRWGEPRRRPEPLAPVDLEVDELAEPAPVDELPAPPSPRDGGRTTASPPASRATDPEES